MDSNDILMLAYGLEQQAKEWTGRHTGYKRRLVMLAGTLQLVGFELERLENEIAQSSARVEKREAA
jgi:hypothetical protein